MKEREITIHTGKEFLEYWMKAMDKLYPETVAKYKKLKIIVK